MSDPVNAATFDRPISGALANTLAAAANDGSAPRTFFVVARYEPSPKFNTRPFNVQMPFENPDDAAARVAELKVSDPEGEYGIFGPFENTTITPLGQATVEKFDVTTKGGAVPHPPFTIEGETFDALFYSVRAVEKFVVPYHTLELGPEFGALILQEFKQAPLALMGHLPWSEEVLLMDAAAEAGQQEAATSTGPRRVTRETYRPVLLETDESGGMRWKRLDPHGNA
jgi:hypothetical protein